MATYKKCRKKPKRTKPREFTENDLARISKLVKESGVPVAKILAVVAVSIGLGWLVCKTLALLDVVSVVRRFFIQLLNVGLAIGALNLTINLLRTVRLPFVFQAVIVGLLSLLGATLVLLRRLEDKQNDIKDVSQVKKIVRDACAFVRIEVDRVKAKAGAVLDSVEDEIFFKD